MRNSDYQSKLRRGSTPRQELGQGMEGLLGNHLAELPSEVPGSSVPSFAEGLHRPDRMPDIQ